MPNQTLPWKRNKYRELLDANGEIVVVWGLGVAHGNRNEITEGNSRLIETAVENYNDLVTALYMSQEHLLTQQKQGCECFFEVCSLCKQIQKNRELLQKLMEE